MNELELFPSIPPILKKLMELAADDPQEQEKLQRKIRKRILPRMKRIVHLYIDLQELRARAQRPRRSGRSTPRPAKRRP